MSNSLKLSLLGPPQVYQDDQPLSGFITKKAKSLLFYLATTGQVHTRDTLAALLWRDVPDNRAKKNLRDILPNLRRLVGPHLTITRQTVAFNHESTYWLDIELFRRILEKKPTQATLNQLHEAVALYRSDFLEGFYVRDAPAFEEWILIQREHFQFLAIQGLHLLIRSCIEESEYEIGLAMTQRLLELEPWNETAHQQRMRLLALTGQHDTALTQYRLLERSLNKEIGETPSESTIALHEHIRTGAFPQEDWRHNDLFPAQYRTAIRALAYPTTKLSKISTLRQIPQIKSFYGRQNEITQLTKWLFQESCQLIVVSGLSGQGKTSLVAKFVRLFTEEQPIGQYYGNIHFDSILWYSLSTALPLTDLLSTWIQMLSTSQESDSSHTLSQKLDILGHCLGKQRCLLILDDFDMVMQATHSSSVSQAEYEHYTQLFQYLAKSQHRSCLVIIGREKPRQILKLERETDVVKSLSLTGLGLEAGKMVFTNHDLLYTDDSANALIQHYSGNPLILGVVADTIQDLFGGDVAAFLQEGTLIFDDIGDVVECQLRSISTLEREILTWQAIESESLNFPKLRANLIQPPSKRSILIEAMRSLQRHSLLQKYDSGFELPALIANYLIDSLVGTICLEFETNQLDLLNRYALLKADAKKHIREQQARYILQPIVQRLTAHWGKSTIVNKLRGQLGRVRSDVTLLPGYAAANILHLLIHLGVDLRGYDFSHLSIWQAYLCRIDLSDVSFHKTDLKGTRFIDDLEPKNNNPYQGMDITDAVGLSEVQREQLRAFGVQEQDNQGHSLVSISNVTNHHNFPLYKTSFIGRQHDLKILREKILSPDCRAVTIMGRSGVGKTRLALATAASITEYFVDGIWFISMANLTSSPKRNQIRDDVKGIAGDEVGNDIVDLYDRLASTIGRAMQLSFYEPSHIADQLLIQLRDKNLLLILDHCESLSAETSYLVDLLKHSPSLQILATSSHPLNLDMEDTYLIDGLPLPNMDSLVYQEGMQWVDNDSVQLFVERAYQATGAFQLTHENQMDIGRICWLTEGLPLGIELVACWLNVFDCQTIVAELKRRIELLSTPIPTTPGRYCSLRAIFDHSWRLLIEPEKECLIRLSIFRSSFPWQTAYEIGEVPPLLLKTLQNKSFLVSAGHNRFEIHARLRQYIHEKRNVSTSLTEEIQQLHCEYYARWIKQSCLELKSKNREQILQTMNADHENILDAWWLALHQYQWSAIEQMWEGILLYLRECRRLHEGQSLFADAVMWLTQSTQQNSAGINRLLGNLWSAHGEFCVSLNELAIAQTSLWNSMTLLNGSENVRDSARVRQLLGTIMTRQNKLGRGQLYLKQALDLSRQAGDQLIEYNSLRWLRISAIESGEMDLAAYYLQQTKELAEMTATPMIQTNDLYESACVACEQGKLDQAKHQVEQAIRIARLYDLRYEESKGLELLGDICTKYGNREEASTSLQHGHQTYKDLNHNRGQTRCLIKLGWLSCLLGKYNEAHRYCQKAIEICQLEEHQLNEGHAMLVDGHALTGLKSWQLARTTYQKALEIHQSHGESVQTLEITAGLARISLMQGEIFKSKALLDPILSDLELSPLSQMTDPFWIYLTSIQVLIATASPQAYGLLARSHQRLYEQANNITDEKIQHSFLTDVPSHHAILTLWNLAN